MSLQRFAGRCSRKIVSITRSCRNALVDLTGALKAVIRKPRESFQILSTLPEMLEGSDDATDWSNPPAQQNLPSTTSALSPDSGPNPLALFFESHTTGRGIWKFQHYFDIYHRHFEKFIGQEVHVVEIGVFSGGSLEMWRNYFGPKSTIYGIDIQEECREYAGEGIEIFIGDQSDHGFWQRFKEKVPRVDIVIDDGGHETRQQMVSLECMLPHLRPGGVYVCEDVHFVTNRFPAYVYGLSRHLNTFNYRHSTEHLPDTIDASKFQSSVQSVHLYPYVTVIEKSEVPVEQFRLPMHGTEWLAAGPFAQR